MRHLLIFSLSCNNSSLGAVGYIQTITSASTGCSCCCYLHSCSCRDSAFSGRQTWSTESGRRSHTDCFFLCVYFRTCDWLAYARVCVCVYICCIQEQWYEQLQSAANSQSSELGTHVCVCVCVWACMFISVWACLNVCACKCAHMCVCVPYGGCWPPVWVQAGTQSALCWRRRRTCGPCYLPQCSLPTRQEYFPPSTEK